MKNSVQSLSANDMTQGNPGRVLLRFALPVLIGNLFALAYNLADTRIVGQFLGRDALAAVGSVSTLSDVLTSLLVGLANGFAVVSARAFGSRDLDRVRRSFSASLLLGCAFALLLSGLGLLLRDPLLRAIGVPSVHRAESSAYLSVLLLGLVFQVLYNCLAANLRAIGDAFTPLLFLIGAAVLNILLDLLFVGPLGWGVAGAAAATVLAQAIAAGFCSAYTRRRHPFLFPETKNSGGTNPRSAKAPRRPRKFSLPARDTVFPLLASGFSMALMSALVAFGTLALQVAINALGSDIIVAHSATRKLTNLYMLPFAVLGTTMATYCGQNYGAGNRSRIRTGIRRALLLAYLWCLLCILISYTICPALICLITATDRPEIIENAVRYQRFDTLFYFLAPTITVLRNSLQGMGDHITPVVSSSLELIGKVVIAMTLAPALGYFGIILAEPIVWAVMVVPLIYSAVRRLRQAKA